MLEQLELINLSSNNLFVIEKNSELDDGVRPFSIIIIIIAIIIIIIIITIIIIISSSSSSSSRSNSGVRPYHPPVRKRDQTCIRSVFKFS